MPLDQTFKYVFENEMPWNTCSVKWTIRDFYKFNTSITSPRFSAGLKEQWYLFLSNADNRISCNLTLQSQIAVNVLVECSVLINGKKYFQQLTPTKAFSSNQSSHSIWSCEKNRLTELLEQHGLKKEDDFVLPIVCELTVWRAELVKVSSFTDEHIKFKHNLIANLTKQWKKQHLTDVSLEANGKIFKGHKIVLAAMSPVFEAMFQEGTKEQEDSHVVIDDVDSDVFEVFLHYLYTGEALQLDEMVADLLAAADKYGVDSLREICIRHMSKSISADNAIEIFVLADRHAIDQVKVLALDFIKSRTFDVAMSDNWETFRKAYPHLVKSMQKPKAPRPSMGQLLHEIAPF